MGYAPRWGDGSVHTSLACHNQAQSCANMINQAQSEPSEALTLKPSTWHMRYSPVPSFALTNRTRPSWARLAC